MLKALFKKEFNLLVRSPTGFVSVLALSLSLIFLFFHGFEKPIPLNERGARAIKWAILFLLNFVFIGQSLWEEREAGAWEVSKSQISITLLYFSKMFSVWCLGSISLCFTVATILVFFQNALAQNFFWEWVFISLGSFPLVALGVALGILSFETRSKEILLPLLQIPFSIPIFLLAREAEEQFFSKGNAEGIFLLLSLGFVYFGLSAFLLEIIVKKE